MTSMKITPELLKKYFDGHCTSDEKAFVESWIPGNEDILAKMTEEKVAWHTSRIWNRLQSDMKREGRTIPLYKKITRYAAAAAVTLMAFGAGYFVDKGTTIQIAQEKPKEDQGLVVYGGNGAYGTLPGNTFQLSFEGQLKLYNTSNSFKTVIVGDITHILEPNKSYYINGSVDSSSMIASNTSLGIPLEGDFKLAVIKS